MGVSNFKLEDLTFTNLVNLTQELKAEISKGNFSDVKDFARTFAMKISGAKIEIDENGKRTINVNGGAVDLDASVKAIVEKIDESKKMSLTSATQVTEMKNMYAEVNKQLTALFKQHEMMEQLASKGFSVEDFVAQADKSNKVSDEKIKKYDTLIKEEMNNKSKVFGTDKLDSDPSFSKKSLITQLQDEKDAKVYLENIKQNLEEIKVLEVALKTMEAEIAADASKEDLYKGNINANKSRISDLSASIAGNITGLKELNLSGLDVDSIAKCQDPTVMNRDDAISKVEALYGVSGSNINNRIDAIYGKMADRMMDKKKGNVSSALATVVQKIKDTSATPAEKDKARNEIEQYMAGFDTRIANLRKSKKSEEVLKVARTSSVAEYQRTQKIMESVNEKFDKKLVQEQDENGNPLFLKPDGTVTTTDTGVKKMKEVLIPKEETRNKYLESFDESAAKDTIDHEDTDEVEDMGYQERRRLLKKAKIGNPFTRLFRALGFKRFNKPILDAISQIDLKEAKEKHIYEKFEEDRNEILAARNRLNETENMYKSKLTSAVVQQKMQDGAYEVVRTGNANPDLIDALQAATYEDVSLMIAESILDPDKLADFKDARKKYNMKEVVQRHTFDVRKNPHTPQHEDKERD